jgi:hypothetical protein
MNGMDMSLLQHRFKNCGYATSRFQYKSIGDTPIVNANKLVDHIASINSDQIHFVCHSLGGLVLRHCLHLYPLEKPGKIVMLGAPNKTSRAAKELSNWPGGSFLLGKSTNDGLLGPLPKWTGKQSLGVIAGDLRFGMGLIIPNIPRPSDGTVSVEETRLEGMQDHITLHVSHFGLLLSKRAFLQTKHFIEHAQFQHY